METPPFSALPLDPGHPPHSAWAVWGADDELGTLNHLTDNVVAAAARDGIRTGTRIGLNWTLQQMKRPPPFRNVLEHRINTIEGGGMHDDTLHFNTQTSSQWDGFRHCGYENGLFYNGVAGEEILHKRTERIGIHAWCKQGIVGRGVLVDFASYAARHKLGFNALSRSTISLDTVKQILEENNTVIRRGFLQAYENATAEELHQLMTSDPLEYPGVDNSREFAEWLWDSGFAAVCTDSPGFEAMPPQGFFLHPVLLAGLGMPIGELFALDELAAQCEKTGRATFFFTSEPLNVVGGVASPPNALAIF
ncbi:uncharacterized protein TRUGW13939_02665 [Talaromyces rugulosus]|uniref:Cyclase n=1 Tax=Talaromyces rugulosus TaxID=121627 RepID=A0A7H8QQ16_TALRU|nr:uncharacterized protein TRUGW13939_02665 [Talaromyces rugulosus]QKX55571.1 hypothetical protein TRUGW13939_02665 [Talaromyces rugulosus]